MVHPGTDSRKGTVCMVVGCTRKALYRAPKSTNKTSGYCADHKAWAMGKADVEVSTERQSKKQYYQWGH